MTPWAVCDQSSTTITPWSHFLPFSPTLTMLPPHRLPYSLTINQKCSPKGIRACSSLCLECSSQGTDITPCLRSLGLCVYSPRAVSENPFKTALPQTFCILHPLSCIRFHHLIHHTLYSFIYCLQTLEYDFYEGRHFCLFCSLDPTA